MTRLKTETKRQEILEGAVRVFAKHGYHATTIGQIAADCGIGLGTFYRYFRGKLDVFRAVVDTVVAVASNVLAGVPVGAKSLEEYRAQAVLLGQRMFEAFLANREFARLLFVEAPGVDPELNEKLDDTFALLGRMTEAYLLHGQAQGFVRADLDPPAAALAINAMVFEGIRQVARADDGAAMLERWSRATTTVMFDGIGVRGQPNAAS